MFRKKKTTPPPPTPDPTPGVGPTRKRKVVGRLNTLLLVVAGLILMYILTQQYGCPLTTREDTLEWKE